MGQQSLPSCHFLVSLMDCHLFRASEQGQVISLVFAWEHSLGPITDVDVLGNHAFVVFAELHCEQTQNNCNNSDDNNDHNINNNLEEEL